MRKTKKAEVISFSSEWKRFAAPVLFVLILVLVAGGIGVASKSRITSSPNSGVKFESTVISTATPVPIPSPLPYVQPQPVQLSVPSSDERDRQAKLQAIEGIDRQIDGLLLLQQEQIKTGRVFLEGFYICEEMQDPNLELSCKEQALRHSDETRAEIAKTQERIDNLELQRAILQSGL